jgi:hypothetical protein
MTCLEQQVEVSTVQSVSGWPEAMGEVSDERQGCALWAGVAWTRWLAAFGGAAGAIDLPVVSALLERAERSTDDETLDLASWHLGVLSALSPHHLGHDRQDAVQRMQDAYMRAVRGKKEDIWLRWHDLVRWEATAGLDGPRVRPHTAETAAAASSSQRPRPGP